MLDTVLATEGVTLDPRQPFASSAGVRRRMRSVRRSGTEPELRVRRALHSAGLRYRVDVRPVADLNRRADVVFTRQRVAVFVDGCFWHGCPEHGRRLHDVNAWYWPEKIARNVERDLETTRLLREAGWHVIRIWEHEATARAAARVVTAVRTRTELER